MKRLDLYHHSLRLMGEGLLAQAGESSISPSDEPYVRSLQLIEECLSAMQGLGDYLDQEDVALHGSVLNQIDLGLRRASRAKTHTTHTVNVWRVIEVSERFLASIAGNYDYQRLSEAVPRETMDRDDSAADELAKLFAEYEDAMATKAEPRKPARPPFSHGVLRWRGSQLFYVQRIEDGARWIELDTNFERRGITEEAGEVETSEARTIEGYPITLMLDLVVDENKVDRYIRSQWGREYYVSGYQIAVEMAAKGISKKRRR
ncbi:MAG: hypothetical protein GTO63_04695 [Anaerolineae bacterium]|nr:hypothetical protein [Anaerolineae bacterium]NIN94303.1 hypothetical protein [Anaerolineae bacterium]